MTRGLAWFRQFPQLGEDYALEESYLSIWDHKTRGETEAAGVQWLANIPAELPPTFKDLTTAVHKWHNEIF